MKEAFFPGCQAGDGKSHGNPVIPEGIQFGSP
jgi:hypothetical protein